MSPSQFLARTPQGRLYLRRYSMHLRGICDTPRLSDYLKLSDQEAREILEAAERFERADKRSRDQSA
jgi:hypothetical protein